MLVSYLSKVHPGRGGANAPIGFGSESFKTAKPVASVGVVGSGRNDINMMQRAKVSFCTSEKADDDAKAKADFILRNDNIADVVNAIVRGRAFKDRLMQFLMLQIPASLTAVAMVGIQLLEYDEILLTTSYIFLINLCYAPIFIACLVREDPGSRRYEMIERWRASSYPGTKSVTSYMRAELLKFSIFSVTLYQIGALGGLFYYAEQLFSLIHAELEFKSEDPLFVD